ncbi:MULTISPECIES: ABC transporter substrate-binding protein [unclassified Paenibacillus]|uniref:ABC transporter substrate-binding protein n=1 Tax=Paenibacillus TaxID=44249 RepID=UPI0015775D78|nr:MULTISPECIES: ABC transporter substrate-binding protein [unclassified Paenibacillus]NTZ18672.1 peptide ABC transporter substrate-binding protein [Paenibacillus sp. JMULE4]
MKKYSRSVLITLFICMFAVTACTDSPSSSSPSDGAQQAGGGTLIIGTESEYDQLDPHRGQGWVTMRVNHQIYESLVEEDLSKDSQAAPVPALKPALATKWEVSPDGKTYTFTLRENVKFHDGTPFDAAAVEFNVRRLTDESFQYYDKIAASKTFRTWRFYDSVKVIDPQTIDITLKEPFSTFPRMLAQINSFQIISPEAVKKYGNDGLGEHPSGTGPFKFSTRVRGEKVELVRNEEYWGEKAKLDKVIFRPLPDPAARVTALQNGEVDVIAVPPPDSLEGLKKQGFQVVSGLPPHVWYIVFNFTNPIMQKKEVRQAINYAINREGIANELLKGTAKPAYTIQSRGHEAFDPNKKWYEYDPEKAKQLLAQAGLPDGFETTFMTSIDGSGQLLPLPMAEWIQRDLAKVGIKLKIQTSEWIQYVNNFTNGMPPEVGMNQFSSGRTAPYFLAMVAHSAFKAPGGFNSGQYVNKEADQLMDMATHAINPDEAIKYWKQAEEMIMEDAAFAPIVNDTAPYVVSPNVKGFISPSEEWYDLVQVSIHN